MNQPFRKCTAVLLLSSNRELVFERRDLIRPDLNKQYGLLCNPSTSVLCVILPVWG